MNVLLISPEYPPRSIGGGGVVYKNLSEQLASKGHNVKVLAGNLENKDLVGTVESVEGKVELNFVPLFPYPKFRKANSASYTLPTFSGFLFILKELVRNRNAVIHLHGFCHPVIDLTALACITLKKKYVITCHGIPITPSNFNPPAKALFTLYLSTIGRLVVKKASILTTVSNSLKNECESKMLTNKKTLVIPNGADEAVISCKVPMVSAIEKKYSLEGKHVIFALGRLSKNKGFQYLIEAMRNILLDVPDAVAVIAGKGPYQEKLENLIEKEGLSAHVKLIGWISEEEKEALYNRTEVVVFPSINEPFGLVLLEALKMKKPLIAFDSGSVKEILRNDCALIVPAGDVSELGKAVVQVISNPELKSNLVAKSPIIDCYSWDKISSQYLNVYQSVNQASLK